MNAPALLLSEIDKQMRVGIRMRSRPRIHECEPGWSWEPPPLSDHDLWLVLGGSGRLTRNGRESRCGPGRAFLLEPGDRIRGAHDPATPLCVFAVHFDFVDSKGRLLTRSQLGLPADGSLSPLDAVQLHARTAADDRPAVEQELAIWALLFLLRRSMRPVRDWKERIEEAAEQMRLRPGSTGRIQVLAAAAHMSLSHFSHCFRRTFGQSPKRYLLLQRIERAKSLLSETPLTLDQIAEATGFANGYHFSRSFRSEVGMPPGRFRRLGKSGPVSSPRETMPHPRS